MTKLLTKSQRAALAKEAIKNDAKVSVELADGVVLTFHPRRGDSYPEVETLDSLIGKK